MHGIDPKLCLAPFATASKWRAKVPVEPEQVPMEPEDAATRTHEIKGVSSAHIKQIFGPKIKRKRGNFILQELQWQRVAGTIDEGIPNTDENTIDQGLEWLRTNYPLDEDAAIMARLDREEDELSEAQSKPYIDRAVELGLYAPRDPKEQKSLQVQTAPKTPMVYIPQQDPDRNRVLGHSYIEEMREQNIAARKEAEARRKAEQEAEQAAAEAEAIRTGVPIPTPESLALERQEKISEKKAMWTEYVRSTYGKEGQGWPTMTAFQRLWPSAVFTAFVTGMSVLFAIFYTPPPKKARMWPNVPPAAATLFVIIGMNVLLFGAWYVAPLQRGMFRYFITVPGYPTAFAIIGNTFSHQNFQHLSLNMLVLWMLGSKLHDDIGRGPFIATYMACGALSSFGSLAAHVLTKSLQSGALGASGALSGVVAAWCVVNMQYVDSLSVTLVWAVSGQQLTGVFLQHTSHHIPHPRRVG